MTKICPNYSGCRLVQTEAVEPDSNKRENYIKEYCMDGENFKKCKRYLTRRALWICPDYVLPDSEMTEDEIAERYEEEEKETRSKTGS